MPVHVLPFRRACALVCAVVCGLALITVVSVSAPRPAAASTGVTSTLRNFDGSGTQDLAHQVTRFDTDGNALDAEEGQIAQFHDPAAGDAVVYVLYGESHACGFQWLVKSAPFCGFNAYTSTDLVSWTYRGTLFDPNGTLGSAARADLGHSAATTWQSQCDGAVAGCFRPHVVYNSATRKYVLWFYSSALNHYYVMTSGSPYSNFVLTADGPHVDPTQIQGDEYLFVDPTSSSTPPAAYIAHAYWGGGADGQGGITIDVQRLNDSYDGIVGPSYPTYAESTDPVYPGDRGVEAPALFERTVGTTPVYYLTYSDPHCAYGWACGTSYLWALSPAGPWGPGPVDVAHPPAALAQPANGSIAYQTGTMLNSTSCGGQPTAVTPYTQADGTTGYLYQSDLNHGIGTANQGTANFYWAPLSFDAQGSVQPFSCQAAVSVSLRDGVDVAAPPPPPGLDQDTTGGSFRTGSCVVGAASGQTSLAQIVTPSRTGTLTSVRLTVYLVGTSAPAVPNAPLTVSVASARGTAGNATPSSGTPWASATIPAAALAPSPDPAQVAWSMRTFTVRLPQLPVVAGSPFALVLGSATTVGCYGVAVTTTDATSQFANSPLLSGSDGAWTATTDPSGATMRFQTTIDTNVALIRPVLRRTSIEQWGWSGAYLDDGATTSTQTKNGYHTALSTNPMQPEQAIIDLGSRHVLDRFVLYPAHPSGYAAGFGFPVRFQLRVSDDLSFATYSVLVDDAAPGSAYPNPGDTPQFFDVSSFPAAQRTGRYAELYIGQSPVLYSGQSASALAEMQVWGAPGG